MTLLQKNIRLEKAMIERISRYAKDADINEAKAYRELLERGLSAQPLEDTSKPEDSSAKIAIEALAAQLKAKDEQIVRLLELNQQTTKLATNAQTLQGVETKRALESTSDKEGGFFSRIFKTKTEE